MKIIFAGTPDFSVAALKSLIESKHQICAVYTQPDRPAGRGRKLTPSPVKKYALDHNIEVLQPEKLKQQDVQDKLRSFDADVMVVVAYGLLLPQSVLDIPRLGCLNIHASILPRWRGAAPIQRAIEAGDIKSGVTIMQMDAGLDTGAMIRIDECAITQDDTGGSLHDKLAAIGGQSILKALDQIVEPGFIPEPQNDSIANYANKLSKQDAKIDWSNDAVSIVNLVRAFNPWPVAHTQLNGDSMRIWGAAIANHQSSANPGTVINCDKNGLLVATGDGIVCINRIQLPGGKQTDIAAFVNSKTIDAGTILR
ncbi:MAG: methionyl-tRNA formyltransferase [Gammaproteobacteria bacterium]|nr:MAG: methionyl-tRNA formyltransferase [Gammaproteobacteria bacterium]